MTTVERISDTVEFFPKQFNMTEMSSLDATFHAAQDLIYALQNPARANPLATLVNGHKKELRTPVKIFRKSTPPAVPLTVPVRGVVQEKPKEVNKEIAQLKVHTNQHHPPMQNHHRMPFVEAYPEELQPSNPATNLIFFFIQ